MHRDRLQALQRQPRLAVGRDDDGDERRFADGQANLSTSARESVRSSSAMRIVPNFHKFAPVAPGSREKLVEALGTVRAGGAGEAVRKPRREERARGLRQLREPIVQRVSDRPRGCLYARVSSRARKRARRSDGRPGLAGQSAARKSGSRRRLRSVCDRERPFDAPVAAASASPRQTPRSGTCRELASRCPRVQSTRINRTSQDPWPSACCKPPRPNRGLCGRRWRNSASSETRPPSSASPARKTQSVRDKTRIFRSI